MAENDKPKNSKARIDANNRYAAKNYDKVTVMLPKGTKDKIVDHAKKKGESMNAYVSRAINTQMKQEDEQE